MTMNLMVIGYLIKQSVDVGSWSFSQWVLCSGWSALLATQWCNSIMFHSERTLYKTMKGCALRTTWVTFIWHWQEMYGRCGSPFISILLHKSLWEEQHELQNSMLRAQTLHKLTVWTFEEELWTRMNVSYPQSILVDSLIHALKFPKIRICQNGYYYSLMFMLFICK